MSKLLTTVICLSLILIAIIPVGNSGDEKISSHKEACVAEIISEDKLVSITKESETNAVNQQQTEAGISTTVQKTETATTIEETEVFEEVEVYETTAENTIVTETTTTTKPRKPESGIGEQIYNDENSNNGLFKVTGYYPAEGFPEGQLTKSGTPVGPGQCAMDFDQRERLGIEFGDKIYVEGVGVLTVTDSGPRPGTVDVWVPTEQEAARITGNARYTHAVYRYE